MMKLGGEKVAEYRRLVSIGLLILCIVGMASSFDQWLTEHKYVRLEWMVGYLAAGCLILLFPRDRTQIAASSFGLVVVLGTVNAVLSRELVALPAILVCAIVCTALLWWIHSKEG